MAPSDGNTAAPPLPEERRQQSREFTITRIFDSPPQQLFDAWTKEQAIKQWFAPKGFTTPIARLNLIPGGQYHYCMRAANGTEMWGKWTFREINPPEHLVFVNTFSNRHGNLTRHPYAHNWPLELLTTITLAQAEMGTSLTIASVPMNPSADEQKTFDSSHEAMIHGWNGTLDHLAEYLAESTSAA